MCAQNATPLSIATVDIYLLSIQFYKCMTPWLIHIVCTVRHMKLTTRYRWIYIRKHLLNEVKIVTYNWWMHAFVVIVVISILSTLYWRQAFVTHHVHCIIKKKKNKKTWKYEMNCALTVLLPKFRTLQLKYADLPTNAVTLFGTLISKYGSFHLFALIIEL